MPVRILAIDDDELSQNLVKKALAPIGCIVYPAYDGQEALAVVQSRGPDLILLDLNMPKLDGWGFLSKLHEDENHKDIPIVVLTTRSGFLDKRVQASLHRVAAYLTKPFTLKELRETVQRLLPNPEAAGGAR
ncbi:MAG: two-component system response regulator [Armatimonadetes bacterium CG_4_10_14_3_um_filter_66_18]|nr:response regulator [Armatimonadota bacterium]PIU95516.1 MAG: two-component system response regulator [Armatimonadetes bacterium CG06_land_8_20_14_3_00_66_21]PIX44029.1 MAG: two-component system response regulator [Armatimonadetes bacterium CG_4_8_14_3_um_filter_66_20]PIY37012.1 MAG: two-component system response regulator [Armatimonadetes bacterium CG_4_10_14_3_um_filter_66_18]PIZ48339.1 MAG: two-component system response regulator [Armatimonadetes bacterium CG_4_10_14_0_8_um_filter_66_14]P